MTAEIVRHQPAGAVQAHASIRDFTPEQRDLLKRTVAKGTTDDEFELFCHVARRRGLDPFVGQIHAVMRKEFNSETKQWEPKMVIQTGIDGYRVMAQRTKRWRGQIGPFWCGPDGEWRDVWLSEEPPAAAKVGVLREGWDEPVWGIALWREYRQVKRDGELVKQWRERPAGQLAKCALALGLRSALPEDMSGVYTDDEMGQADNPPATTITQMSGPTVQADGEAAHPVGPDTTTGTAGLPPRRAGANRTRNHAGNHVRKLVRNATGLTLVEAADLVNAHRADNQRPVTPAELDRLDDDGCERLIARLHELKAAPAPDPDDASVEAGIAAARAEAQRELGKLRDGEA